MGVCRCRVFPFGFCLLTALSLLLTACGNGDDSLGQDSPPAASENDGGSNLEDVPPMEVPYEPMPTVEIQAVIDTTSGVDVQVATIWIHRQPLSNSNRPGGRGRALPSVCGRSRTHGGSTNTRSMLRYQSPETTRSGSRWRPTTRLR